ncbi:hypothetical protein Aduo_006698 [Ancylostoma duodenale]
MCKGTVFNWLGLYLVLSNVSLVATCTFSKVTGKFVTSFKYQIIIENEERCIPACYEKSDCVYVVCDESFCSIYSTGNENQTPVGTGFKLDRQLLSPSCSRRVEVGQHMTFQKYPAPTILQGLCKRDPSTPTTTISIYRTNDARFLTNNPNPTLPAGAAVARRTLRRLSTRQINDREAVKHATLAFMT